MNKQQIKAELRREATRRYPMFAGLSDEAFNAAWFMKGRNEFLLTGEHKRIFFLLVAEAL